MSLRRLSIRSTWTIRWVLAILYATVAVLALVYFWVNWGDVYSLSGPSQDKYFVAHLGASALFVAMIALMVAEMRTRGRRRSIVVVVALIVGVGTVALFGTFVGERIDDNDALDTFGYQLGAGVVAWIGLLSTASILVSWVVRGVRGWRDRRRAHRDAPARLPRLEP
jgi:predicted neutral ceramidase superfamily lipid hydrolase